MISGCISSINRNIVECKDDCFFCLSPFFKVLIETLWNVKIAPASAASPALDSINRNIVECKAFYLWQKETEAHSINRNIVECKVVTLLSIF